MRCNFRSTTALAAALALMAPAALLAETLLAPKAAATMDAAARAEMPRRAATLDEELSKGLGPNGLTCIGGTPRPCPDGEALVTPKGLAVHLSRNDTIVLAPRKEQRAAARTAQGADAAARAAAAEAPAVAAQGGEQAAERRKAEKAQAKAEREEAKAQATAERQAAKAARQSGEAEAQPGAGALAASLALAEGGADTPLVMAQAEAPAAAPVVVPEPAPAEPVAVEPAPPAAEPAPVVEAAEPQPQAEPPAAEPPVVEPAPMAEPTEPMPAPEAQASPVVEEPAPLSERSEPIPKPRPAPAAAEPAPATGRAEPMPEPQPEPVVSEPAPETGQAEPLAEPQPAPRPVVAEPAPPPSRPQPAAEPVVVQPQQGAQPQAGDAGTPDAAALAAALAAAGGGDAPVAAPAETAAAAAAAVTGQDTAPTPVVVDEAATRSLEETLQKAAEARAPAAGSQQPAARTTPEPSAAGATAADAAAAAAAAGSAPVAEALNAPATIADDATAVVVTEGSARSSSEDFATRLTEGLTEEQQQRFKELQQQLATQGQGGQPVVAGDGSDASRDDDDNKDRDLARMLLAGVGGYALANVLANNGQIALSTPDRVVVQQPDGTQTVIKDDNALLLQPGAQVTTENFADGSSRSIVTREDGSRVVTIRDANLRVLRRTLIAANGTVTELIDDAAPVDPVVVADLPPPARPVEMSGQISEDALRAALAQEAAVDRRFTLAQIRNIPEVRGLVSPIEIDAITFDTGSAAIRPDQAQQLATLGKVISDYVRANPGEVFLIEGHTDTVGAAAMNLALSDRRAESVALALSQYFHVPPENMVVQGYGEQSLKVNQEGDIRANRRASVRRITDLLARS